MTTLAISVKSGFSQQALIDRYKLGSNCVKEQCIALSQFFRNIAGGIDSAAITVNTGSADPVAATATIPLASCTTDTVTIGTVTLTGSAAPANQNEFDTSGGSDTADAAALASCINAHTTLSTFLTASSALGVVTITAKVPGVIGNQIALAETGTTITLSGAFMAGGTGGATGTATAYSAGL
jgi:phage tail sheath gpL-like